MNGVRPEAGHYAAIRGLDMYYEIHGSGDPLVLIHGGFGLIGMFAALLPVLAESRQVIAVELQGHGHTADVDRPFTYEQMADDVAALMGHLGLEPADVVGFSLGGGVAWQTAIRHPWRVRKLVVISAPCRRDGWMPDVLASMHTINADMAAGLMNSPMYEAYQAVNPRPENWPALAQKSGDLLRTDYDWSAQVAALPMPVQIITGDADSVPPAHAAEMYRLLGGGLANSLNQPRSKSELAILPGVTHYDIIDRADLLRAIIPPFLNGTSQPAPEMFAGAQGTQG